MENTISKWLIDSYSQCPEVDMTSINDMERLYNVDLVTQKVTDNRVGIFWPRQRDITHL